MTTRRIMAECRDLESLFAAYVDGEAATGRLRGASTRTSASCAPCRSRVAAERVVRDAVAARRETLRGVRDRGLAAPVRGTLSHAATCRGRTGGRAGASSRAGRWVPLSMVATLVLAVAGVFIYGLKDGIEALGGAARRRSRQVLRVLVTSRDHSRRQGARPRMGRGPRLDGQGAGERARSSSWSCSASAAASRQKARPLIVMYKWRGQPLSVYVLNSAHPRVGAAPQLVERFGQEELIWSKEGRTYAVVTRGRPAGDRARGALRPADGGIGSASGSEGSEGSVHDDHSMDDCRRRRDRGRRADGDSDAWTDEARRSARRPTGIPTTCREPASPTSRPISISRSRT